MELVIKKVVAETLGLEFFAPWGAEEDAWVSWRTEYRIDMADLSTEQLDEMHTALEPHRKMRGVPTLLWDIEQWKSIVTKGVKGKKARTVRQFEPLLLRYLLPVPGHRIYQRHEGDAWLCYYVGDVEFTSARLADSHQSGHPAYVTMDLIYEAVGGEQSQGVSFYANDCIEKTVEEALAGKGYIIETDELRADYLTTRKRFKAVAPRIGRQFWAEGKATTKKDRYSRADDVRLDVDGQRSRVVVDVFHEGDESEGRERSHPFSDWFWPNVADKNQYDPKTDTWKNLDKKKAGKKGDEEEEDWELDEDTSLDKPKVEIPVHPWLIVYHLKKHRRLQAHVNQLADYTYDTAMAEKLVLPQDQKDLVKLLIDTGGGVFRDIVQDKGGGAVVLLTGPPGTGKTLTAEVYAESEERALYSVQCSQLGLEPDNLEEELLTVFERAKRWGAVLLLDEADVYIHARGSSLQQNAIVGVFLRVLEYQEATMFLTSNRPEDIDDAIASRCIARLNYEPPSTEDAERIWAILTTNSDIKMVDTQIKKTVAQHPDMTGRDIKNIIKLAALMPEAKDGITAKMATYVHQFKPTGV